MANQGFHGTCLQLRIIEAKNPEEKSSGFSCAKTNLQLFSIENQPRRLQSLAYHSSRFLIFWVELRVKLH